ncbi:hypothetical protein [Oryza sativa Japonica Group]|uniref:Uncharacterized protein n=2 Tax=Oryza sativa subsp. japonica TaxID=39947 RepID=Q5Z8E3_ORYSJ|nr:hypothetical protein [Oryza sativa Japonica Group]BAD53924.1 hypothetical protein [Oryza sativa Japonica Group]
MVPVGPNPVGAGVVERRKLGVGCDIDGVSPPPSIHGGHSTVPPAQGSGEVLRQPEAEEEVQQGWVGGPQPELQSHGGEGALMAREAENGIHDPMKDQKRYFFLLSLRDLLRESDRADNVLKVYKID